MKTGIASEILEQKLKSKKALENPQMLVIEENTINSSMGAKKIWIIEIL